MSAQHTPGPWTVEPAYRFHQMRALPIYAGRHQWIAQAVAPRGLEVGEVERANARLIAAAPELLLALQTLLDWHTSTSDDGEEYSAVRDARAAIAKATGIAS